LDQPPPGGRCPDGSRPQVRDTVRKLQIARRESISEKIEAALQEADAKKVTVGGGRAASSSKLPTPPSLGKTSSLARGRSI
jgi:hypothetical protein